MLNKDLLYPQTGSFIVPDSLALLWSPLPETCAVAQFDDNCPTAGWQVEIFLPPELVQVGTVDLADQRVYTIYWGDPSGPPSCAQASGEGEGNESGTMNIVSLEAQKMQVTFPDGFKITGPWTPPASAFAGTQTIPLCQPLGDAGA